MLKKITKAKESLAKSFARYRRFCDQKAIANPLKERTCCLLLNPKLTEQSAFSPKLIQKWLALYRIEKVLTDSNYLIRKVGTTFTQTVHRIRIRPITPQYPIDDIADIDPEKFVTDPQLGKYRGEQGYFDKGLPTLLENEKNQVPTPTTTNFDSPVRVSISFGTTVLPPAILPAPAIAAPVVVPPENQGLNPTVAPGRVLTPPEHLTAQIPDSSEKSDESVEPTGALRRSERIQNQNQNRYQDFRFFEAAGKQFRKMQSTKRTSQGERKEASNFVDLLNNRRKERQQMQFVQQTGAQQSGSNMKKQRLDFNAIEDDTRRNIRIVRENLFSRNYSMGHCVSSDFHMGAGIAAKLNQLYPQIIQEASKNLTPGSVFAYHDKNSRRWIYNLVTKFKFFHKPFYESLRMSLQLMRNHAEHNGVHHIRLPKLGCGLHNLQ